MKLGALGISLRQLNLSPFAGASLVLGLQGALDSRIAFTRGSVGTYFDVAGVLQTAAINAPRFDFHPTTHAPLGLLMEESRQNVVLNSAAPATQTVTITAGNWTVWMTGTGSVTSSAGTATATGFGAASAGVPNVINVTVGGTVTLTVAGGPTLFQCENGAFPTSYIATVGAPVTRSADAAVISTLTPWYNAAAGTLFAEWDVNTGAASWPVVSIDDGVSNNYIRILGNTTSTNAQMGSGAVNNVNMTRAGIVTGTTYRQAFAVAVNDAAESLNAAAVNTDVTTTMPVTPTQLVLGSATGGLMHIKRVAYWPSRLPNTQLLALTA